MIMIINTLIIHSPNSPNISLKSYLPSSMPQLQCSSTDSDDSDDNFQSISNSNDISTWHYQLAQSLISMYDSMHAIITGFDEISQNMKHDIQQQKIQLEMMRMALMLNPSDLLTYNNKVLTFPYIDLRNLENSSMEEKSYQHERLRLKIQRIILQLKRGMDKLRLVLFSSSYQDKSSSYIRNYRKRIEKSLLEIRAQMIEYNRVNQLLEKEKQDEEDELTKHRKTINQIISQLKTRNPLIEKRIEDYRMKLEPKHKNTYTFISSPLIRLESQSDQKLLINEKNFFHIERLEFPDLNQQANEFFGLELSALSTPSDHNAFN